MSTNYVDFVNKRFFAILSEWANNSQHDFMHVWIRNTYGFTYNVHDDPMNVPAIVSDIVIVNRELFLEFLLKYQ